MAETKKVCMYGRWGRRGHGPDCTVPFIGSVWKCNVSPWSSGQPEREVGRMVGEGAWDSSVNCLLPECSLPGEVA